MVLFPSAEYVCPFGGSLAEFAGRALVFLSAHILSIQRRSRNRTLEHVDVSVCRT